MMKATRGDSAPMAGRLSLALALALTLLAPLGAASPGEGEVVAEGSLRLEGHALARLDGGGVAWVDPDAAALSGLADEVNVTLHAWRHVVVESPLGGPVGHWEEAPREWFETAGADVRLADFRESAQILVHGEGLSGEFSFDEGDVRGFAERTVIPAPVASEDVSVESFFSWSPEDVVTADAPDGRLVAAGDVELYLYDADLVVAGRTFETGVFTEERAGPMPLSTVTETRVVWAIVRLEGAEIEAEGGPVVIVGASAFELAGDLTAPLADVAFTVDGVERTARAAAFALEGSVVVAPAREGGAAPVVDTDDAPDPRIGASVRGDILSLSAGAAQARDPRVASAAAATGVAVLAFAGWALYTRLTSPVLLDNDVRADIYKIVCDAPGIGAREVHRRSGRSWGTVMYHLRQLEKHNLVKSKAFGRLRNYYENHGKWGGQETKLAALKGDRTIQLARAIVERPGIHQDGLVAATGLPQSTVSVRVKRLREAGLVDERREARFAAYFPTEDLVRLLEVRAAEAGASETRDDATPAA